MKKEDVIDCQNNCMSQWDWLIMGSQFSSVHDTNDCDKVLNSMIYKTLAISNEWATEGPIGINVWSIYHIVPESHVVVFIRVL